MTALLPTLRISAAFLTFIGSVLVGFSVAKNPGDAHQVVNGKPKYLAIVHLEKFKWGMILMTIGFFIQMAIEIISLSE